MGKNFEAQGEIYRIGDTQSFGQNGFTKREFVLKLSGEGENPDYPNYVAFELIKDKCALMDSYQVGDELKVHFNLNGRLWSAPGKPERCFTSLQAWRIEALSGSDVSSASDSSMQASGSFDEDIPF
ncbi:MAG: DUF3127 domain-containing protein [Pseudomonadota bacterium]|nr:DUF3127 domain-containing protein [Pseudomonadota bacterium]